MRELVILILSTLIFIILTIGVMIFGWGLEPRSWWWIIGGGVFGKLLICILEQIGKES